MASKKICAHKWAYYADQLGKSVTTYWKICIHCGNHSELSKKEFDNAITSR